MSKLYDGINIQWPISQLIFEGKKTIETRTYSLPSTYLNKPILLIETPGKKGGFKSRIIAEIRFTSSFLYKDSLDFYLDQDLHFVSPHSEWAWKDKPKYGWKVEVIKKIDPPIECLKRGITFRKGIELDT